MKLNCVKGIFSYFCHEHANVIPNETFNI